MTTPNLSGATTVTATGLAPVYHGRQTDEWLQKRRAEVLPCTYFHVVATVSSLSQTFSDTPLDADLRYRLVGLSDSVRTVESRTRWVHLEAYSGRQKGHTSISGIVGHVVYEADDWAPFWPWLKWGELIHVGKNAVKGEGMVRVLSAEC